MKNIYPLWYSINIVGIFSIVSILCLLLSPKNFFTKKLLLVYVCDIYKNVLHKILRLYVGAIYQTIVTKKNYDRLRV